MITITGRTPRVSGTCEETDFSAGWVRVYQTAATRMDRNVRNALDPAKFFHSPGRIPHLYHSFDQAIRVHS
jgi:hypothetical protein